MIATLFSWLESYTSISETELYTVNAENKKVNVVL